MNQRLSIQELKLHNQHDIILKQKVKISRLEAKLSWYWILIVY